MARKMEIGRQRGKYASRQKPRAFRTRSNCSIDEQGPRDHLERPFDRAGYSEKVVANSVNTPNDMMNDMLDFIPSKKVYTRK
jgi:hypothetical protein